jgi:hypothetical protein
MRRASRRTVLTHVCIADGDHGRLGCRVRCAPHACQRLCYTACGTSRATTTTVAGGGPATSAGPVPPGPVLPVPGTSITPGLGEPDAGEPGASEPGADGPGLEEIREQQSRLVSAEADWNRPEALNVNESERIGLSIGDSPELNRRLDEMLPDTVRQPVRTVRVNTRARAILYFNQDEVEVEPDDAVIASPTEDIGLLWTWFVKPKKPTEALKMTAHLEVPIDGADPLVTEIPLEIPVNRTAAYTAGQIFSNWGTWSAIVGAGAAGAGWWIRRMKRTQPAQAQVARR